MFEKYKNIHLNESAYILGSGPTINDFSVDDHTGVYIGVNDMYFLPQFKDKLHYLMTDKFFPELALLSDDLPIFCKCNYVPNSHEIRGNFDELWPPPIISDKPNCVFYSVNDVKNISNAASMKDICAQYYGCRCENPSFFMSRIALVTRLAEWGGLGSIIFHGLFFALHMGCKKIHLVGCDCSGDPPAVGAPHHKLSYFKESYENRKQGWEIIKKYVEENHPDVEIININPVNLIDMFPSIYTKGREKL